MISRKQSFVITIQNPLDGVTINGEIFGKIKSLFLSGVTDLKQMGVETKRSFSAPKLKIPGFSGFNKKNLLRLVIPILLILVLIIGFSTFLKKNSNPQIAGVSTNSNNKNDIKTTTVNREFKFPLKDEKGKQLGTFSYTVESAELRHQIVVKGQNASSVPGRIFFIVNIKLVNSLKQGLQINSRDYIRISVNGNDKEWFAPDIHSDPVEAQAISTKNTRVALAINESDKNIRLQIGEIDGKKEIIPITFHN